MPSPRKGRRGRRLVGGLVLAAAAVSLVGLATPTYADDDYPYRGLGQCPLVPLPPRPPPAPTTDVHPHGPHSPGLHSHGLHSHGPHSTGPHSHGARSGGKPGAPIRIEPPAPPPPPVRVCAKHVWYLDGSYGDPWNFALRNCTSFVAWRLRETNGVVDFTSDFGGARWGDAHAWDDAARSLGYPVDGVPAVGAVAQTDTGSLGHVAWVSSVGDGYVTVEEYNYAVAGGYDVRTVPTSDFRYLHLADVAPAPYLGTTRAAATAVDARGGVWAARTTPAGDLTLRGPSGRPTVLGARGAFSPSASPTIVTDAQGQMWLAAVTHDGHVVTTRTDGSATRWRPLRPLLQVGWSTTSSPTLVLDGQDLVRLYAVTSTGDLDARTLTRAGRWGRPTRLGRVGSWSTHASVAAASDDRGRLWLAAVTRTGTLSVRHTRVDGTRGTPFRAVDQRAWSPTSTPSLTSSGGRVWLTAVTARGLLVARYTDGTDRWRPATRLGGTSSPYASPVVTPDLAGRVWLASTASTGGVVVRSLAPGSRAWRVLRTTAAGPVTTGPALVAGPAGGVELATPAPGGLTRWQFLGASARHRGPGDPWTTSELVRQR